MDLVQTVRKEGSRGGRGEFKWDHVKADAQRENYLGHSLMAPVGRWQQGRDLNWYAKGDAEGKDAAAERIKEEKRRLKEAEEDAMLAAMGLPVPERNNANLTPLGDKAHGDEKLHKDDDDRAVTTEKKDKSRRHRDDHRERKRRRRSRSRSRDRERRHGHRERSRSRSRDRRRHEDRDDRRSREHRRRDDRPERTRASRSRSRDRRRKRDSRSTSPYERHQRRRD